ncbi:hypothetical protein GCG54_00001573 [Colletotrichum gloeosporioides]|uniref:Spo12-like protein n=1 Tax=Colletotrichum gloeosporioides TaxID=474922 RepID=A0A8H4CWT7_COLGL|nr:uncharacterized protein GCG54_00001573 [Colletotrichum gloeosporioides]KAF3811257.1 hypothetical protein GCG54_00001573 [Colletotrichum gloeosporioides]
MSPNVLTEKSTNTPVVAKTDSATKEVKSMEYHRQVLQDKMAQENADHCDNSSKDYISPSDNIMSPCTAKLNALRNKQVGKVKPKSLFAQASAKKVGGSNLFSSKTASPKENAF